MISSRSPDGGVGNMSERRIGSSAGAASALSSVQLLSRDLVLLMVEMRAYAFDLAQVPIVR